MAKKKTTSKFAQLKAELAKKPGVKDPGAVAAAIGRKKLGQAEMTKRSVAARTSTKKKKKKG